MGKNTGTWKGLVFIFCFVFPILPHSPDAVTLKDGFSKTIFYINFLTILLLVLLL